MEIRYVDKHGREIKAGMTIRHDSGDLDVVVSTIDSDGHAGLGVGCNAWEAYPLYQFDPQTMEIVEDEDNQ